MWAASQDGKLADSANLHAFDSNGVWLINSEASSSHRWIGSWLVVSSGFDVQSMWLVLLSVRRVWLCGYGVREYSLEIKFGSIN